MRKPPLDPEPSASTNSATSAKDGDNIMADNFVCQDILGKLSDIQEYKFRPLRFLIVGV